MSNKAMIMRECDRRNTVRRVYNGSVKHSSFFADMRGDLLISGYGADDKDMVADLICEYAARRDMPTVLLTGHIGLLCMLKERERGGYIDGVMVSSPHSRNYHPFYGMNDRQIMDLIRMAAEDMGYGILTDQALLYASAMLNTVSASYPLSLPAISALLTHDDDHISAHALQKGLSNVIADNIRGNTEGGIIIRRIFERLTDIFDDVYTCGQDTGYNIQSGAMGRVPVMALYSISPCQRLFNTYMKEELFSTLKRVPMVRVVLDDTVFTGEDDELLTYLFHMKRLKKIELSLISANAKEAVPGQSLSFANVILFGHDEISFTEELSGELWGTYPFSYPVPIVGKPPAFMELTLKSDIHWQITVEDRLRVRAEDLYASRGLILNSSDKVAVKKYGDDNIYLVKTSVFMPVSEQVYLPVPKHA